MGWFRGLPVFNEARWLCFVTAAGPHPPQLTAILAVPGFVSRIFEGRLARLGGQYGSVGGFDEEPHLRLIAPSKIGVWRKE
jgi:hypothetical protein